MEDAMSLTFHDVMRWSDDQCREFLEGQRWPDGPICPKCGVAEPYTLTRKSASKNSVRSLYKCRKCRKQFTATVGTIFEDSHIPLSKWFAAIYLMTSSKKGVSAHQIHRTLGVTYKSAWFMCHRVREAMREKDGSLLSGVIEADETYVGRKGRRGHPVAKWEQFSERERLDAEARGLTLRRKSGPKRGQPHQATEKAVVFGMMERGGRVRTMKIAQPTAAGIKPIMIKNIAVKDSYLMTDGHHAYRLIRHEMPHSIINHEIEYVRGDIHTQGIENYWSIVKRSIYGIHHHVSENFLPSYLSERDFVFNSRKIADAERFAALMGQTRGRLLWYCRTAQAENPYA